MNLTNCLALLFITFLFQSCVRPTQLASSISKTDLNPKATIVVMRPNPTGTAIRNNVYHNGELIGFTGVKSYLSWDVEPGKHTIGSSSGNYDFEELDAKAGETYYFKQAQRVGLITPNVELVPLEKDIAMRKFSKLRQATLVDELPASAHKSGI